MARTYAFYKGTKAENDHALLFDRLICWWPRSRGRFSHAERVICLQGVTYGLSSSVRDGGVRQKPINFETGRWEFVTIPGDNTSGLDRFKQEEGKGFDYVGLLGFVLPVWLQVQWLWFCSEICSHMEYFEQPSRMSPSKLYAVLASFPGAKVRTTLAR